MLSWSVTICLAVKLFDVANQGHCYIVNSLRTWEYPIGDPVQFLNWFLSWKWGCVLLWPEVIFFSSALCASLTRLRREVSIRKKISSGTQGISDIPSNLLFYRAIRTPPIENIVTLWGISLCIRLIPRDSEDSQNIHKSSFYSTVLIVPNSFKGLQQQLNCSRVSYRKRDIVWYNNNNNKL